MRTCVDSAAAYDYFALIVADKIACIYIRFDTLIGAVVYKVFNFPNNMYLFRLDCELCRSVFGNGIVFIVEFYNAGDMIARAYYFRAVGNDITRLSAQYSADYLCFKHVSFAVISEVLNVPFNFYFFRKYGKRIVSACFVNNVINVGTVDKNLNFVIADVSCFRRIFAVFHDKTVCRS